MQTFEGAILQFISDTKKFYKIENSILSDETMKFDIPFNIHRTCDKLNFKYIKIKKNIDIRYINNIQLIIGNLINTIPFNLIHNDCINHKLSSIDDEYNYYDLYKFIKFDIYVFKIFIDIFLKINTNKPKLFINNDLILINKKYFYDNPIRKEILNKKIENVINIYNEYFFNNIEYNIDYIYNINLDQINGQCIGFFIECDNDINQISLFLNDLEIFNLSTVTLQIIGKKINNINNNINELIKESNNKLSLLIYEKIKKYYNCNNKVIYWIPFEPELDYNNISVCNNNLSQCMNFCRINNKTLKINFNNKKKNKRNFKITFCKYNNFIYDKGLTYLEFGYT
jgi:hypothetical protein